MKIAMIGTGYVGLVSGACFAEFGLEVVGVDKDAAQDRHARGGQDPDLRAGPGRAGRAAHRAAGRLTFTTDLAAAIDGAEAVFIGVGTPSRRGDGHADLTYVFAAAEEIAATLKHPTLVVTKSTVPVGTGRKLQKIFASQRPDLAIDIASNPEFLREGSAIEDFLRPDRVVCGVESEHAQARCWRAATGRLNLIETPILFTTLETAELIKYATNAFLATKITFINEVADLCERVGADVQQVAKGMGLDGRIGKKFLHAGPGYGGSCFPKDTLALLRTGEQHNTPPAHRRGGGRRQRGPQAAHGQEDHRRLRRLGRRQDDRGPGRHLQARHRRHAREPVAGDRPRTAGRGCDRARVRSRGHGARPASCCPTSTGARMPTTRSRVPTPRVILTEWNEFRGLDFERAREVMRQPAARSTCATSSTRPRSRPAGFATRQIGRPVAAPI